MDEARIARYRKMIEDSGSHTGEEAERLARSIALCEEQLEPAQKGDRFITSPDGMFFLVDQDGFVIPLTTFETGLPKEAEVTTSLAAPQAVNNTFAIVRFGSPIKAEVFKARSIFKARAKAEEAAMELRTVALAMQAGTFGGSRPLFRSLAFVDYIFDSEKQLEPSTNTIQALTFAKSFDADSSSAWAVDNGLEGLETQKGETCSMLNRAPASFHAGSLVATKIADGVMAVLGRPRKSGDGDAAKMEEAAQVLQKAIALNGAAQADDGALAQQVQNIQDTLGKMTKQLAELTEARSGETPPDDPAMDPTEKADDSDWSEKQIERFIPFTVIKEDERIVMGLVYEPDTVDAHGDFMTAKAIKEMAHDFMIRYREDETAGIDKDHDSEVRPLVPVIESAIAQKGNPDFKEGAWFLAVKVLDDAIWEDVKAKRLTGFSFAGLARARPVKAGRKQVA